MKKIIYAVFLAVFVNCGGFGQVLSWWVTQDVYVWDATATTFFTNTGISSPFIKYAINELTKDLKAENLWSSMKCIYPFVGGTNTTQSFNLKSPYAADSSYRITWSGTVTSDTNGVDFNGSSYGNTHLNPSTVLTANNTHISMYRAELGDEATNASNGIYYEPNIFALNAIFNTSGTVSSFQYNTNAATGGWLNPAGIIKNNYGYTIASKGNLTHKIWFNGTKVGSNTTNGGSLPNGNFYIGANNHVGSAAYFATKKIQFFTIGSYLDSTQCAKLNTIVKKFQSNLKRKHLDIKITYDGNSLTSGTGSSGGKTYPWEVDSMKVYPYMGSYVNYGISGQKLSDMISSHSDVTASYNPYYEYNLLCVLGGVNDFGQELGTTKETIYDRLKTYCLARKAEGFKVIALTLLPQSAVSYTARTNYETERIWFNNQMRTDLIQYIDGIADIAGDSRIGDSGDQNSTVYYNSDKIHLNNKGYQVVAGVVYSKIKTVIIQ